MILNTSSVTIVLVASVVVAFVEAVVKATAIRRMLVGTVILVAVGWVAVEFQISR